MQKSVVSSWRILKSVARALGVTAVLGVLLSFSKCGTPTSVEKKPIEIVEPLPGQRFSFADTITIRVRFDQTISAVYVQFSKDSGLTYQFIAAERHVGRIGDYFQDIYYWVPADNSLTEAGEILLLAFDYADEKTHAVVPILLE